MQPSTGLLSSAPMIRFGLIIAVMCLLSLPVMAGDAGVVKTMRGEVRIERVGSLVEVGVGDVVQEGDRVRVRGNGSVGISLRDETLISLGPNSTLVIDTYRYDPTTRVGQVEASILKGTLRFVTGLIGRLNPESVRVVTPTATVGIRGTDFIVEVPGED
jgi:hypothetical protein